MMWEENPELQEGIRECPQCKLMFKAYVAEVRCPTCREINLRRLGRPYLMPFVPILESEYQAWEQDRERWDMKILDENGREVWALDLASRYRGEMIRYQHKDYSQKKVKLTSRRKFEILRARGWHIERH